jgi:hypothetical protein
MSLGNGESVMKIFVSMFTVTLALAFTVPAFAGGETKEQCQKDGGTWDAKAKYCSGKY